MEMKEFRAKPFGRKKITMDGYAVPNIFYAQNFSYSILSLLNSAVKRLINSDGAEIPLKKVG
ncbi:MULTISPECIES: hypothetical protein [Phocaeicola]|jgi:hypothetical protein|uniref:Uncharacterized protein n=2 Tax=Phocaeicola vulgatus TaxID=821 RepID=A0A1Q6IWY6_PHOVU|nr:MULTISPECIES: hypothetical protein [Phocaeicola]MBS6352018.1 hypothetical protein [Phocaeicola vulgatus]MCE8697455.1 hypothetical protein [Phocaeicola vulgatus]MCE8724484.1 hypothetical protein [Phocaeicola vulgatus]MCE9362373.1 hypothetical protein [Phocaeicola vulgatus]MCE9431631.1 hypothetical protein [Phocaeicola vulgatus]